MRIKIRTLDPRLARELLAPFEFTRFEAAASIGAFSGTFEGLDCDIVLYDARSSPAIAAREASRLRLDARAPLILAAATNRASGPNMDPAFDLVIPVDGPPQNIVRLLEEGLRDAIGRNELAARTQTLAELLPQLRAQPAPSAAPLRALYAGKPHSAFFALEQALQANDLVFEACLTISAAFDRLHEHAIDALIINLEGAEEAGLALCGALRRNAALQGLPAAALTDSASVKASAFAKGALEAGPAMDIAQQGISWLSYFARHRRERHETRAALERSQTALESANGFSHHLDRVMRQHIDADRSLCLVALQLRNPPGSLRAETSWRKGLSEAIDMARRLVRTADCAAMDGPNTILWMLPCTPFAEAERLATRAVGVLEHTGFVGAAGPIVVAISVCERLAGESSEGLLRRTLEEVRQN